MNEERKILVEEVDSVEKPKLAKVEDAVDDSPADKPAPVMAPSPYEAESDSAKLSRKKDYLEGFLAQKPAETPAGEAGGDVYEAVIDTLKSIFDPEIPVNIYDLGLIYGVDVSPDADVTISMTLTTPNCPVAESMPAEVELRAGAVPGVRDAEVVLVWDPAWDPGKMSDEARLELGML